MLHISWVRPTSRWLVRVLALLLICALPAPSAPLDSDPGSPGQVGFSFSPKLATDQNLDPIRALTDLLMQLTPDLVRLPVYWDLVAPSPDVLDFSSTDALLRAVHAYNRADRLHHHTSVLLVVGARNLGSPEVHVPAWADSEDLSVRDVTQTPAYLSYLEGTFSHYGRNGLLQAWQVENEPLDNTNEALGDVSLPAGLLAGEIERLKAIDPVHPIVVTTYDSATVALDRRATSTFRWLWDLLPGPRPAGSPMPALQLGDVLGLDIYVVTPSTPLEEVGPEERIDWKAVAVDYWAKRAAAMGKQLWITEMEGAPWDGVDGFTQDDLLYSARAYRNKGVGAVLIWGVESWLTSPEWMATGQEALAILRD